MHGTPWMIRSVAVVAGILIAGSPLGCTSTTHPTCSGHSERDLLEGARVAADQKVATWRARGAKPTDRPGDAAAFFMDQRLGAGMVDYPMAQLQAEREAIRVRQADLARSRTPLPGGITSWTEAGPGNIGGRTRTIVIDPTNPDVMYGAGVAGGVWKSTDAGASWGATDDFLASIAVSTIAMDPTDPSVLYAGTGEGVFSSSPRGLGIFKSVDAGVTWTQLASTANAGFYFVNKIQVSPNNPDRIYAGTQHGVWRSFDGGATWDLRLRNPRYVGGGAPASAGCGVGCLDLDVRADMDPDVLFACFGSFESDGLYRSVDGGETWVQYGVPANQGRMSFVIAPSDNDVMYLAMADNGSGGPLGALVSVFRSLDGGDSWTSQVDFGSKFGPWLFANNLTTSGCVAYPPYHQGWHDNVIAVDPMDPDIVWIGGVDILRSDDAGVTWGLAGQWVYYTLDPPPADYIHADHHEIVFHPGYNGTTNQTMYAGNDGGIFRTDNARAATTQDDCPLSEPVVPPDVAWVSLNNEYGVTQFYHGDAAKGVDRLVAGAQDNGTNMGGAGAPNDWDLIFGGDGGYVAIDPTDDDTIYIEIQFFPEIRKSTDGGETFVDAVTGITDTDGVFIVPFAMDQRDPRVLWTGGRRPWRTTDGAASWQLGGPDLAGPANISAIAIAPSDSNVVYLGYSNGYVSRTTNALDVSPAWLTRSGGLPIGGWVSSVAVDPTDPDRAYCTYSTFGVNHVYETSNGGQSWTPIDSIGIAGVPDIPVHWIAVRPCDPRQLYAGTELGVFASDDRGATWAPANAGLANTIVESLDFKNDNTLVAFTHGRGAFVAPLAPCEGVCAADLTGDGVLNVDDIDAFVAAFVGGDPIADLDGDGSVNIDDIDAFVASFLGGCGEARD